MDIQNFIKALGGAAQVSRDLGVPLTTVATWGQRNRVPQWRVPALIDLAIRRGQKIPPVFTERAA